MTLCVLLLFLSKKEHISPKIGLDYYNRIISTLSRLLLLTLFLQNDTFTELDIARLSDFIPTLMYDYAETIQRHKGNKMRYIKFHLLKHVPHIIEELGAFRNVNGGVAETMMETKIKQTARRTLMMDETFDRDTSIRDIEAIAIHMAATDLNQNIPTIIDSIESEFASPRIVSTQGNTTTPLGLKITVTFPQKKTEPHFYCKTSKWSHLKKKLERGSSTGVFDGLVCEFAHSS